MVLHSTGFKGSVDRSLLPSAIFLIFTRTDLESLKITSPRCFSLKCQRKDSKKVKEHRHFRGVLGRWRTAAIDRTLVMPVSDVEKRPSSQFFLGFGVSFGEKKPLVTSNVSF